VAQNLPGWMSCYYTEVIGQLVIGTTPQHQARIGQTQIAGGRLFASWFGFFFGVLAEDATFSWVLR